MNQDFESGEARTPVRVHKTISDFASGRDNNFNLLRFTAALSVLLSHCWPLFTGSNEQEPLSRWADGLTLGTTAVMVFFAVSGFLVASSWERSQSARAFGVARVFRVFPGLLVALLLSAFVLGPFLSTLNWREYYLSVGTWTYVPSNLLLAKGQTTVPGVLETNRYAVLNGSLWTLAYEFACYVILLCLGMARLITPRRIWIVLGLCAIAGVALARIRGDATHGFAHNMITLGTPFLIGLLLWVWRRRLPLNGWIALLLGLFAALALGFTVPANRQVYALALAYGSIYLAYVPDGLVRQFNRLGDASYGMYIYAFPIQQALLLSFPRIGIAGLFFSAAVITAVLAALSWMFVEKPAQKWGRQFSRPPANSRTSEVAG